MDPEVCFQRMRDAHAVIVDAMGMSPTDLFKPSNLDALSEASELMAAASEDMCDWVRRGGYLPEDIARPIAR